MSGVACAFSWRARTSDCKPSTSEPRCVVTSLNACLTDAAKSSARASAAPSAPPASSACTSKRACSSRRVSASWLSTLLTRSVQAPICMASREERSSKCCKPVMPASSSSRRRSIAEAPSEATTDATKVCRSSLQVELVDEDTAAGAPDSSSWRTLLRKSRSARAMAYMSRSTRVSRVVTASETRRGCSTQGPRRTGVSASSGRPGPANHEATEPATEAELGEAQHCTAPTPRSSSMPSVVPSAAVSSVDCFASCGLGVQSAEATLVDARPCSTISKRRAMTLSSLALASTSFRTFFTAALTSATSLSKDSTRERVSDNSSLSQTRWMSRRISHSGNSSRGTSMGVAMTRGACSLVARKVAARASTSCLMLAKRSELLCAPAAGRRGSSVAADSATLPHWRSDARKDAEGDAEASTGAPGCSTAPCDTAPSRGYIRRNCSTAELSAQSARGARSQRSCTARNSNLNASMSSLRSSAASAPTLLCCRCAGGWAPSGPSSAPPPLMGLSGSRSLSAAASCAPSPSRRNSCASRRAMASSETSWSFCTPCARNSRQREEGSGNGEPSW
mmetsp:Transcript_88085/g.246461  ORF Transcript_88085/g.246461 Transcript_88085/m.246461 type:complete len:565 (+) Transcript_88085:737-2431(+)